MSARRFLVGTLVVLWSTAAHAEILGFTINKIEGVDNVTLDDRFGTTASSTTHKVNYKDCLAYLGISAGQSLAEPDAAEVVDTAIADGAEVVDAGADVTSDVTADTTGGSTGEIRKISIDWSVTNSSLTGKWWYSIRVGTGCSESAEVDVEATDSCTYLRQKTELERYSSIVIEIPLTRLLGTECTKGSTGEQRIYFTIQSDANYTLHDNSTLTIDYDYDPPKSVGKPTLNEGETNLSVSWESNAANTDTVTYKVYWSDATFNEDTLEGIESRSDLTATDYQITGLVNGTTYWVAVATLDDFDNESPLSTLVSGSPVQVTDGFEFYKDNGGADRGGFGCSVGERGAASAAVLLLLAVALAAVLAGARRPSTRRGA